MGMSEKDNKFYAFFIEGEESCGVVSTWDICQKLVSGKKAKFRKFYDIKEAKSWLLLGCPPKHSSINFDTTLEDGIYFDSGTGAGEGVEVRITDKFRNPIINLVIPSDQINERGNYNLSADVSNNYGELFGCYLALLIAAIKQKKCIWGDSKLVIDFWSRGIINNGKVNQKTLQLSRLVSELRKDFEKHGGKIEYISGDINPADLGFHK